MNSKGTKTFHVISYLVYKLTRTIDIDPFFFRFLASLPSADNFKVVF